MQLPTETEALEGILRVWTVQGPMPPYHELMKYKLRREWPELAAALDKAALNYKITENTEKG